jgi:hypothetical protein
MTIASLITLNFSKETSNLKLNAGKQINAEKIKQTVQNVISSKENNLAKSETKNLLASTHSNKLNTRVNSNSNNKGNIQATPSIKFYPVNYVKQLSPAGKAALEAQKSGE